jgi:hypothetical protein
VLTLSVAMLGGEIAAPPPLSAAPLVKKSGGGTDEQARLEELLAGTQQTETSQKADRLVVGAIYADACSQAVNHADDQSSGQRMQ